MTDLSDSASGIVIRGIHFGSGDISRARAESTRSGERPARISIPLSRSSHDALKIYAIRHDTTITCIVVELIEEMLRKSADSSDL